MGNGGLYRSTGMRLHSALHSIDDYGIADENSGSKTRTENHSKGSLDYVNNLWFSRSQRLSIEGL